MASFCSSCGAPAGGRFCPKCGAATGWDPGGSGLDARGRASSAGVERANSGPVPVSAPPAAGTSSAAKIILIVVGVVVLLGAIGVAGLVYVGYRAKQKIAELKQEYGVTSETAGSSSSGSTASARVLDPRKGAAARCWRDRRRLGFSGLRWIAWNSRRTDQMAAKGAGIGSAPRSGNAWRERKSHPGINAVGKGDDKTAAAGVEKLIGGVLGAAIEASGDNKNDDFAFSIQLWRSGGRSQWEKIETAKSDVKGITGVDFGNLTGTQQVEGIGDKAMVLPAGHSIMVLKGDEFFLLGFQQFVPGREKTIALARAVAGRL